MGEHEPGETSAVTVAHPLVDFVGDGFVATVSDSPVVGLTEGRMGLLVDAARQSTRVLLITPPESRLTLAMTHYLQLLQGQWVIRNADGALRVAANGRVLQRLDDAWNDLDAAPIEVAADFAQPLVDAATWLQFTISTHHAARDETMLGRALEMISEEICGEAPTGWGVHEPAGIHWNRENLTRFVRGRMPRDTRLFATGGAMHPLSATLQVFRSAIGVTEETKILIALGSDRAVSEAVIARVPAVLAQIASTQQVLFGMAYEQSGAPDATFTAVQTSPPLPVASVIGARAIRDLNIDIDELERSFGAIRAGSRRVPSLVVPFGADPSQRWAQFAAGVGIVGAAQMHEALGLAVRATTGLNEQGSDNAS
ncbi:hypothetical protein GCM10022381_13290 [Leifsonia kafniensis]|uniref:Uncharacterized protein n=1 Tax=Leifsonia kafniensis TaxID=475957 RepID=A0ABP7KB22_9MICO